VRARQPDQEALRQDPETGDRAGAARVQHVQRGHRAPRYSRGTHLPNGRSRRVAGAFPLPRYLEQIRAAVAAVGHVVSEELDPQAREELTELFRRFHGKCPARSAGAYSRRSGSSAGLVRMTCRRANVGSAA
jgi:hypothetical protein